MRTIDADAVQQLLKKRIVYLKERNKYAEAIDLRQAYFDEERIDENLRIRQGIETIPTIDAVPVVKCKDCKHRPQKYPSGFVVGDERCPCICDDHFYSWYPDDNWFCANGERRETMGRLVDLDTVPHWKITNTTNIRGHDELCETDMVLMKDLENAPAVDAAPVVRCKDCKHAEWWGNFEYNIGQYFCEFMEADVELKDDDYCSRGERRETDDETD